MAQYLTKGLNQAAYDVVHANNADQGQAYALSTPWDLAIIDRMLPQDHDGIEIINAIRQAGFSQPIIVLSALSSIRERVRGLNEGGNDYLIKPFDISELIARIKVQFKSHQFNHLTEANSNLDIITIADLVINVKTRKVMRAGQMISLQPKEFHVLEYLARNHSHIVTRTMLLETIWYTGFQPETNVIEALLSRLRSKIDKDFDIPLVHTVRGKGYRLGPKT